MINCVQIHLHNFGPFFTVGLANRLFDCGDGLFTRQNPGNREETSLHDRVDPSPHPALTRDFVSIDNEKSGTFFYELTLCRFGKIGPQFLRSNCRIQ